MLFSSRSLIAGSITGTVAAITTKQGIFAVTPLTIAIGLNVINRQRFNQLSQKQVEHLQQLIQHNQDIFNGQVGVQLGVELRL
jgi:ribosomal protein S13